MTSIASPKNSGLPRCKNLTTDVTSESWYMKWLRGYAVNSLIFIDTKLWGKIGYAVSSLVLIDLKLWGESGNAATR